MLSRRRFLATVVCIAGSQAAQSAAKVIRMGVVFTISPSTISPGYTVDFWQRLRELGWIRGSNLLVEERWAHGRIDRMPALIDEVIGRNVDLILTGSDVGGIAAARATQTIPVVVTAMADPIAAGVAASLSRPGRNLTGLSLQSTEGIPGKCLQLLREALPRLATVAVLWNPDYPASRAQLKELEAAALSQGVRLRQIAVRTQRDLPESAKEASTHAQAMFVLSDVLTFEHRVQIAELAVRYHLPTVSTQPDFAISGALMAYGADLRAMYRRAAEYVDKILRGAKPGDLPIEQPTQFKLIVNSKTSQLLGISLPESILLRADEVIK